MRPPTDLQNRTGEKHFLVKSPDHGSDQGNAPEHRSLVHWAIRLIFGVTSGESDEENEKQWDKRLQEVLQQEQTQAKQRHHGQRFTSSHRHSCNKLAKFKHEDYSPWAHNRHCFPTTLWTSEPRAKLPRAPIKPPNLKQLLKCTIPQCWGFSSFPLLI